MNIPIIVIRKYRGKEEWIGDLCGSEVYISAYGGFGMSHFFDSPAKVAIAIPLDWRGLVVRPIVYDPKEKRHVIDVCTGQHDGASPYLTKEGRIQKKCIFKYCFFESKDEAVRFADEFSRTHTLEDLISPRDLSAADDEKGKFTIMLGDDALAPSIVGMEEKEKEEIPQACIQQDVPDPGRVIEPADEKNTNPKDAISIKKVPTWFIPTQPMFEEGLVMMSGARKYGAFNWRAKGIRASVYVDAAMRHIMAFKEGENNDPESRLPHLAHAKACLSILRDSILMGNFTDDRPLKYPDGLNIAELNKSAEDIIKRYPECKEPFTEIERNKK